MRIEDIKEGDYVRMVKCAYPFPREYFLGEVSKVGHVSDGLLWLDRWGFYVDIYFVEKVNSDTEDIYIELTEDRKFKLTDFKYIKEGGLVRIVKRDPSFPDDCTIGKVSKVGHIKNRLFWLERWEFYIDGDSIYPVSDDAEDMDIE